MQKPHPLPAIGAVFGALFFPLIYPGPLIAWRVLQAGFVRSMAQLGFSAFVGAALFTVAFLVIAVIFKIKENDSSQTPEPLQRRPIVFAVWFTLSPALHLAGVIHNSAIVPHYSPKLILTLDVASSALLLVLASIAYIHFFSRQKSTAIGTTYFLVGLAYAVVRPALVLALQAPEQMLNQLILFLSPPWFLPLVLWCVLASYWIHYSRRSARVLTASEHALTSSEGALMGSPAQDGGPSFALGAGHDYNELGICRKCGAGQTGSPCPNE